MKIFVWGIGRYMGHIVDVYIPLKEVYAFIDSNAKQTEYLGKRVLRPCEMMDCEYDAILVTCSYSEEIHNQCVDLGIDLSKVIFLYNQCVLKDLNTDYSFVESIVGKDCAKRVRERVRAINGVDAETSHVSERFKSLADGEKDYVRIKTLELVTEEIERRAVNGAVAELGVFRGDFSKLINAAFPKRKLYLFDTFTGFDDEEVSKEIAGKTCTEAIRRVYEQTSIEQVLGKMTYRENVVIKQGLFPQSLNGLEEKFAFVSLDVDFEESILEGLRYFYPRLSPGGYLFVHDFYSANSLLAGVRWAVERYEKEENIILCKVPLCDVAGSLVITK